MRVNFLFTIFDLVFGRYNLVSLNGATSSDVGLKLTILAILAVSTMAQNYFMAEES